MRLIVFVAFFLAVYAGIVTLFFVVNLSAPLAYLLESVFDSPSMQANNIANGAIALLAIVLASWWTEIAGESYKRVLNNEEKK